MNRLQRAMHESPPTLDFSFPSPVPLVVHLRDVLDDNVDAKYFIDKDIEGLVSFDESSNVTNVIAKLDIAGQDCIKRIYGINSVSPTLSTMQGGQRQPKVIVDE